MVIERAALAQPALNPRVVDRDPPAHGQDPPRFEFISLGMEIFVIFIIILNYMKINKLG